MTVALTSTIGAAVALVALWWLIATRYQSANARRRSQFQWVGAIAGIGLGVWMVVATANVLFTWPEPIGWIALAASSALPLGLATASSTRALAHAERLAVWVLRTLLWLAFVAIVVIIFVVGLVQRPDAHQRAPLLAATLAALGIVAIAPILKPSVASFAERFVSGDRRPVDDALRVLTNRASRTTPIDELLIDVVDALTSTLGPAGVELWRMVDTDTLECTVANPPGPRDALVIPAAAQAALATRGVSGPHAAELWLPGIHATPSEHHFRAAPIAYSAKFLGMLIVRRDAGADAFSDTDLATITEIARQLGLLLYNARLDSTLADALDALHHQAETLRESRARVVAVADEERRRIERDLHDGAQQDLVALAVSLGVVAQLINTDPEAARAMIDEMRGEVQGTIDGIRALAHGIYPPLLATRGLAEALRSVAGRANTARVTVRADNLGRYSPDIESAVYFCCLEALANAAKHAPGVAVYVGLAVTGDELCFTVTDVGPGFDAAAPASGQGLVNMVDRIGAVGGQLRWSSESGEGTVVTGSVPIDPA